MHPRFSLSRRELLKLGAAAGAFGGIQVARSATLPARGGAAPALIVVLLRGGMDGLSLVAPHGERAYYDSRSSIALPRPGEPGGLLRLDNLFGLHPAMAPLMHHWQGGNLAFVHASGSADPTRSHFDAQDYLESGTPGLKGTSSGWMNRLASVLAGPGASAEAQRLQSLTLGPPMPRIFSGDTPVASLENLMAGSRLADDPALSDAFSRIYQGDDALSRNVREVVAVRREMQDELRSDEPRADAGALSLSVLARNTAELGRLMANDGRIRLAFVPVGGWDTHVRQGNAHGQLAERFGLLAQSLQVLATSLGERLQHTTILALSEFGRTVKENGTRGTDHGHGNVAMVMGGGVRGGRVHGRWPGLDTTALYQGRDLAVTTDFRDIIGDVLESRLRLSDRQLATVLPQMARRNPVGLFS